MTEIQILEASLKAVSLAFNDFVKACSAERGKTQAPSYGAFMKAKASLPPYCSESFKPSQKEPEL